MPTPFCRLTAVISGIYFSTVARFTINRKHTLQREKGESLVDIKRCCKQPMLEKHPFFSAFFMMGGNLMIRNGCTYFFSGYKPLVTLCYDLHWLSSAVVILLPEWWAFLDLRHAERMNCVLWWSTIIDELRSGLWKEACQQPLHSIYPSRFRRSVWLLQY